MHDLAYYAILGRPLIMYVGIVTILVVIVTASIGFLNMRRIRVIPFKWHKPVAYTALALAVVHGFLGLSAYL